MMNWWPLQRESEEAADVARGGTAEASVVHREEVVTAEAAEVEGLTEGIEEGRIECIDDELTALFDEFSIPRDFRLWLAAEGISTVTHFAYSTATETAINTEPIDASRCAFRLVGKSNVHAAWCKAGQLRKRASEASEEHEFQRVESGEVLGHKVMS